jgi:hypothetical protein
LALSFLVSVMQTTLAACDTGLAPGTVLNSSVHHSTWLRHNLFAICGFAIC